MSFQYFSSFPYLLTIRYPAENINSIIVITTAIVDAYPISSESLNVIIIYTGTVSVEKLGPPRVIPKMISTTFNVQIALIVLLKLVCRESSEA